MKPASIKKLREKAGMNVTKFGQAIGVSRVVVAKLESGELTPDRATIEVLRVFKRNLG